MASKKLTKKAFTTHILTGAVAAVDSISHLPGVEETRHEVATVAIKVFKLDRSTEVDAEKARLRAYAKASQAEAFAHRLEENGLTEDAARVIEIAVKATMAAETAGERAEARLNADCETACGLVAVAALSKAISLWVHVEHQAQAPGSPLPKDTAKHARKEQRRLAAVIETTVNGG